MLVRTLTKHIGSSSQFNVAGIDEVIVNFPEGDADSFSIGDLEVEIEGHWVSMREAFQEHALVTDNFNCFFFEPRTDFGREHGWED